MTPAMQIWGIALCKADDAAFDGVMASAPGLCAPDRDPGLLWPAAVTRRAGRARHGRRHRCPTWSAARALAVRAATDPRTQKRFPLAKPWTAAMLALQGHFTAEVARRLHASDGSVRGWVKKQRVGS